MTRNALWLAATLVLGLLFGDAARAQKLDEVIDRQVDTQREAAASQQQIDRLADQTEKLVDEYREVLRRTERLRVYNAQLERLIASQEEERVSLRRQIDDVGGVSRDIRPLMAGMIDTLAEFVELDVPFLLEERRERVAFLRDLMERADVSDAERYRRVLEAYQIESDYGRNIEAYEGNLEIGGQTRKVDFLSVGRVALIYQTLDGAQAGVWDALTRSWRDLGDAYRTSLRQAFRVAREQAAPDLLRLPVPAPEPTPAALEAGE